MVVTVSINNTKTEHTHVKIILGGLHNKMVQTDWEVPMQKLINPSCSNVYKVQLYHMSDKATIILRLKQLSLSFGMDVKNALVVQSSRFIHSPVNYTVSMKEL